MRVPMCMASRVSRVRGWMERHVDLLIPLLAVSAVYEGILAWVLWLMGDGGGLRTLLPLYAERLTPESAFALCLLGNAAALAPVLGLLPFALLAVGRLPVTWLGWRSSARLLGLLAYLLLANILGASIPFLMTVGLAAPV